MDSKILVLGDGLLGSEIVKQTDWDFVSRKFGNFDINNLHLIPNGYNVIVNCVAHTDTYSEDKAKHMDVNVRFVDDLVKYCNERNIKLIHISTDFVYASEKLFRKETDIPSPHPCWYAYSKLIGDELIQLKSKEYLICRCSHKPKPFPYEKAWGDYYTNADYVDVIANLIITLINKNATGLINVGTKAKTMFNLAKETRPDIKGTMRPPYVPENVTMDLSKLEEWV